jgi:glycosyltransferase involved in cell wall biosynthesis
MKTLALSAAPDMADRVRRVYNPLDIEDIRRKAAQTDGICAGDRDLLERKYLIMASRLDERQKDISSLLGAYGRVKDRIPEDLCILGSGADRERLEQRAAALGCGSRVVFPGRKNNPYPWLANATAVVHSSRLEGFPNVLLEALALGKAILATDCKLGPAEILDNGMCGLLRDVGDVDGMAEGLERLVTDSELRRGLERKAVERAKIFDAARVKDDFLQILEQALTRGAGSRM